MEENNKKLYLDLEDSTISHLKISTNPILSSAVFRNSILAVNELSAGLTVGMLDTSFLTSYQGVLTAQKEALNNSLILGNNFQLEATKINNFIEESIGPMSSMIAGIGLATVNANKLYEIGSIGEIALANTQKVSDLCLDVVQRQQGIFASTLLKVQDSGILRLSIDSIASTQVISSGINTVLRSLPTFPTEIILPNLETIYKKGEITEEELPEHQKKLDKFLLKINPKLVEYRKACWETFNKKGKDYIGQSSSSMRRLVDDLLRTLAPTEEVMDTEFFKESKEAKDSKGKPTRKARVYHIVKFDKKKAEHFERLAKGFLEAYGNLSAWDHEPLKQDSFVYGVFITIEGHLISLLSETEQ